MQYLPYLVQVLLADHELTLGVHVVDPAVPGGNAADIGSPVAGDLLALEPPNDVVDLVEDLGLQPGIPGTVFWHDALRKSDHGPGNGLRAWVTSPRAPPRRPRTRMHLRSSMSGDLIHRPGK